MIRPASTVMLVRPGVSTTSYEVFMLRRSAKSAFAPDVFVFPGGTVDEADSSPAALERIEGLEEIRLARMFRSVSTPLLADHAPELHHTHRQALLVAALREVFEECGVLFTTGQGDLDDTHELAALRSALHAGTTTFGEVLEILGLRADAGVLELFSQWITPPGETTRRFDAHFFVARANAQSPRADTVETHDEVWIEPADALLRNKQGTFAMVYPTIKHLERLAEFTSVDELMAFARRKPIIRIMPNMTPEAGFVMPAELEYAW